jgi:hypothetical protein
VPNLNHFFLNFKEFLGNKKKTDHLLVLKRFRSINGHFGRTSKIQHTGSGGHHAGAPYSQCSDFPCVRVYLTPNKVRQHAGSGGQYSIDLVKDAKSIITKFLIYSKRLNSWEKLKNPLSYGNITK